MDENVINWAGLVGYLQLNWGVLIPWVAIIGLLFYAYHGSRKHKVAKPEATAGEKRDWFKYLRLKLWYKPRGFVMSRKRMLERERCVRDLISFRQLMVIEMAWVEGEITHAEYKKYTDELAYRFSNPSLFKKGRLTAVKKAIKDRRKELKLAMTLKEAGILTAVTPQQKEQGENQTTLKPALTKAA